MKTHVVKLDHVVYVREDGKGNHLVCRMMSHHGEDTAHKISHAINQHDKLVAMLQDLEWEGGEDWDLDGHAIPCCPSCGGHHTGYSKGRHEPDCALAALLKEDKP